MCSECTKQAMAIQFPSGNHKNGLLWHTYHIDNVPPPIYLMILTRVGYKFDLNNSWARNCGTPIIEESMVYEKMCKYLHYYNITSLVYLYHLSRWLSTKGAGSHRTLVPTNITLGLLIRTLISENQDFEKSRSISNPWKFSGSANLNFFFQVSTLKKAGFIQ